MSAKNPYLAKSKRILRLVPVAKPRIRGPLKKLVMREKTSGEKILFAEFRT